MVQFGSISFCIQSLIVLLINKLRLLTQTLVICWTYNYRHSDVGDVSFEQNITRSSLDVVIFSTNIRRVLCIHVGHFVAHLQKQFHCNQHNDMNIIRSTWAIPVRPDIEIRIMLLCIQRSKFFLILVFYFICKRTNSSCRCSIQSHVRSWLVLQLQTFLW